MFRFSQKQSMESFNSLPVLALVVIVSICSSSLTDAAGSIGINYGRIANNLPPPAKVVELLKSQGVDKVKLYDAEPSVLTALSSSNISVVVALPNELLPNASSSQDFANSWVQKSILPFYPSTHIQAIAVGNEVFVDPNNTTDFLVPAMRNIHAALAANNLDSSIKISSPVALSCLQTSYPSSSGSFKPELVEPVIKPVLDFHRRTGSQLMVNAYPFFAYESNADVISLDYALFRENPGVVDSGNGLKYFSLLEAQLDAVYAAMSALKYNDVKIVVSETGWPSKGDEDETGSGQDNAAAYNGNLVRRVLTGKGTPLRPDADLQVYLFALFNENKKSGPTSEKNYGLFYPNEQKVYNIPLTRESLAGWTSGKTQIKPNATDGSDPPVSTTNTSGQTWCVANGKSEEKKLQAGLDYACGEGGVDCRQIQPGATCYDPDTLEAHASFAFNSYYQKQARATGSCDFGGAAYVVTQPPRLGKCQLQTGQ